MEHALLIAEKVATALDHAYNTTIDGDRTLHGLVLPGFVAISDDGEVRLSGFGLTSCVLPALRKPRLASDVAPYLAPEERERNAPGKNSDVYSVGVILLELLTLEPPPADPLATVKGLTGAPPPPVAPEILSVLRMALAPADTRYKSSGDLRRELGKLLFSGPYSPSTFNLAYFLHELFRGEIEAETTERLAEGGPSAESATLTGPAPSPEGASTHPLSAGVTPPSISVGAPSRRGPLAAVGAILAAAAIGGGVYVVARKPAAPAAGSPAPAPAAPATPTLLPALAATPAEPTSTMSEAQFREEVARRLALEVQKLEQQARARAPSLSPGSSAALAEPMALPVPTPAPAEPVAEAEARPEPPALPTQPPPPPRPSTQEGALVELDDVDTPPRIARVVKPAYPPLALQARIGGIVVLRVLVSEKGAPAQIEVLRGGRAGLTESALRAVKGWTFQPAVKDGVPVRTWISVPIPFEP